MEKLVIEIEYEKMNNSYKDYIKILDNMPAKINSKKNRIFNNAAFNSTIMSTFRETDSLILAMIDYISEVHGVHVLEMFVPNIVQREYSFAFSDYDNEKELHKRLYIYLISLLKDWTYDFVDCKVDFIIDYEKEETSYQIVVSHPMFTIIYNSTLKCFVNVLDLYIGKFVSKEFTIHSLFNVIVILYYLMNKVKFFKPLRFSLKKEKNTEQLTNYKELSRLISEYIDPLFNFNEATNNFLFKSSAPYKDFYGWTLYEFMKYEMTKMEVNTWSLK